MDLIENVGRRARVSGDQGDFIDVGVFSVNGFERNSLWRNDGSGHFAEVAFLENAARIADGRGLGVLDIDRDGDLDLVLNNYLQPAELLVHRTPSSHGWLELELVGVESNRSAIGARVVIEHGGKRQEREVGSTAGYLSGQSLRQHFGLGDAGSVDALEVRWPSGRVERFGKTVAKRAYRLREGDGWLAPVDYSRVR